MSNIGDDERLVVLLEARITDLERNLRRADQISSGTFSKMQRDAKSATSQMEADMERSTRTMGQSLAAFTTRAGTLARAFAPLAAGAAAGGAALAGLVATARSTAREIATIGDEARRAGLSVRAFQELKFVADQNRVSVDALTDGMKELSLRADEFIVTGSGSGAEAFRRLGFRADELKVKLRDPSALFTEIIGKLQQLDKAAQIRIADELFGGTGGEQFVQLIDQGAAGIRRMIQQANDLGIVMDEKMIDKAAEIDRQFGVIVRTVEVRLKGAIVNAADALRDFFDYWNETQDQQDRTLQDRLGAVFEERQALMDRIAEMQAQDADPLSIFKNTNELKLAQARLAELTSEAARLKQVLDERNGLPGLGQDVVELDAVVVPAGEALDAYGQSLVDLRARLQGNVDGLRLTADTFGQTAGAIAAARFEATAMAEALRAATAAGKDEVDANTATFIRERAAEYGALTDQIERNTTAERERQEIDRFAINPDPEEWVWRDELRYVGVDLGRFDDLIRTFDATRHGLPIMEAQRRDMDQMDGDENGAALSLVGGHMVATEITSDGITQRVVHRWADEVGVPIQPASFELPRPGVPMITPGMSRAERRRVEKLNRKSA